MKDDETNDPPPDPSRSPRIERNVIAVGCRKFGRRRRRAASAASVLLRQVDLGDHG
jgi:hypothetical protein